MQASIPVRYGGPVLTRRALLAAGVAGGVLAGTGCSARDPSVAPTTASPTVAAPASAPVLDRHAALQAGLAAAIGTEEGARLGAFRDRAARDLARQADVLSPGAVPSAPTQDLPAACRAVAEEHLAAAARGVAASRLASAAAYAAAVGSLAEVGTPRVPAASSSSETVPSPGDAEAMAGLLTRLHPAVHALQAALPRLAEEDRAWARTTLEQQQTARQVLHAELVARSLRAPVAEVAYRTGPLTSPEDATTLVSRVQESVLPAACQLVRTTASPELRRLGGEVLQQATVAVARCGGALATWPGWA